MKRTLAAGITPALLVLATFSGAVPLESVRSAAELQFRSIGAAERPSVPAIPEGRAVAGDAVIEAPNLGVGTLGRSLGSFDMNERLDIQRDMIVKQLGAQTWDMGIAGDSEFKVLYFTFRRPGVLLIKRINNIQDLRGRGVDVQLDGQTTYNFKVEINIFNPVRNSKLKISPVSGTRGPAHEMTTGDLLDSWKARSFVFESRGKEYWLLYTTDVDKNTDQLANTRSFVYFHENGMNSKFWPVAEQKVIVGQPLSVDLGGNSITMNRAADGKVELSE
ncbi:MAG: hypothetical protein HY078_01005 [Elusimicrobia bacterium]|nr:hypothetical protein [Elusimicrobiota bacterium]